MAPWCASSFDSEELRVDIGAPYRLISSVIAVTTIGPVNAAETRSVVP